MSTMDALLEAIIARRRVSFLVQCMTLAEYHEMTRALNIAHVMSLRL